ncbi:hypothetical protein SUGI_0628340 [Cryptomeria japonica]|uniref:nodulin-26 isoform X2 n=1 Tax=Cryptomeria japonica TaxID=3369 RepID=UPI002414851A|nr:nodulin-26 isoform X2 [Cryptomeria japonica]GLJ31320.1 hypothetical protein SUGI_0628340 [Cryptomeria japonica]
MDLESGSTEIRTSETDKNGGNNPDLDGEENVSRRNIIECETRFHASRLPSAEFIKKLGAEMIGTFFLIFSGCGSVLVDKKTDGSITHLGVSIVWGLTVMLLIYSVGHISGAHFNPSVTVAFATVNRFPVKEIPGYIVAQLVGSISAGFVLRLMFGDISHIAATVPSGSNMQSFVLEFLITFLLMFVVCGVGTDTKAVGELGGLTIGATVAMVVIVAGPISGASLNPARTLGSAIAGNKYTGIWIYMVAPVLGAIAGTWTYNLIRLTDVPQQQKLVSG